MKSEYAAPIVCACLAALTCMAGSDAARTLSPQDSASELIQAPGWAFEARLQKDSREVDLASQVVGLEVSRLFVRVGCDVMPFLHVFGDAGWAQADVDNGEDGEGGLHWAVGLHANLAEYVVDYSPVLGKKESLRLDARATYRKSQSNAGSTDFEWTETEFAPTVVYLLDFRGPENWRPYDPTGVAMTGGLVFNSLDGDYGDAGMEENRNFGLLAGVDMRLSSGMFVGLEGRFFSQGDAAGSVGVGYRF